MEAPGSSGGGGGALCRTRASSCVAFSEDEDGFVGLTEGRPPADSRSVCRACCSAGISSGARCGTGARPARPGRFYSEFGVSVRCGSDWWSSHGGPGAGSLGAGSPVLASRSDLSSLSFARSWRKDNTCGRWWSWARQGGRQRGLWSVVRCSYPAWSPALRTVWPSVGL